MTLRCFDGNGDVSRAYYPSEVTALSVVRQIVCEAAEEHGFDTVLTGGREGVHQHGSLHYVGLAEDVDFVHQVNHRPAKDAEGEGIVVEARLRAGPHYDILWHAGEKNHCHYEFQPKHGPNQS